MTDTFNWTLGNHQLKSGGSSSTISIVKTAHTMARVLFPSLAALPEMRLPIILRDVPNPFARITGCIIGCLSLILALFPQDDWRISHKLTVDLGVRWEGFYPFSGGGTFGTFRPGVQSTRFPTAPIGLLVEGDPGIPHGVVPADLMKFVPRFGFAYDVRGDGTTSIRGGFGMFYATRGASQFDNTEQQPFMLDNTAFSTPNLVTPYLLLIQTHSHITQTTASDVLLGRYAERGARTLGFPYVMEYNLPLSSSRDQAGVHAWPMWVASRAGSSFRGISTNLRSPRTHQ